MNSWASALGVALLLYVAACLYLYLVQRNLIYYPTPESANSWAVDLRVPTGGETLQVWQLNPGQSEAILYFGGNAEDVAGNIPDFARIFRDYTVYLVNYRGYGTSTGTPSEAGLFADAEAVYDHIANTHSRIHAMGRSLGSGVAVYLAAERDLGRLVLITPYDSIASVAAGAMPLFPVNWLVKDRFDSTARVEKLTNETLALVAENDNVIPRIHSERLVAAFKPEHITTVIIPRADHNNIGMVAEYWNSLGGFFNR